MREAFCASLKTNLDDWVGMIIGIFFLFITILLVIMMRVLTMLLSNTLQGRREESFVDTSPDLLLIKRIDNRSPTGNKDNSADLETS